MKYGDFSSLVQLGVGLHAGTALLQLYGDIGTAPFQRTVARIRGLIREADPPQHAHADALDQLESDFDIFRIQLFNEFKKYVIGNFAFAFALVICLLLISYEFETTISDTMAILISAASVAPAPISVAVLWYKASCRMKPLKRKADALEERLLGGGKVKT